MSKKRKITVKDQRQTKQQLKQKRDTSQKGSTIWVTTIVGAIIVVATAIIIGIMLNNASVRANNASNPAYPVVDGIACQTSEQLAYHVHAHLSLYVNGQPVALPAKIGIAADGSCIYWLHTHNTDGIIHIESPNANKYSLGTFFKLWEDYFSSLGYPAQLDSPDGWQVYVDGKPFTGDFHTIQLDAHKLITMAYNSPGVTPDKTYSWGSL